MLVLLKKKWKGFFVSFFHCKQYVLELEGQLISKETLGEKQIAEQLKLQPINFSLTDFAAFLTP